VVQRLSERWFVVRNAHVDGPPLLMQPRWAMSMMRGPMTRTEMQAACAARATVEQAAAGKAT